MARAALVKHLTDAKSLAQFPITPQSWTTEIAALRGELLVGTSVVYADIPRSAEIDQVMLDHIHSMLASATQELLIVNAYIIPSDRGITALRTLKSRGVEMTVLTNSLASHDVPAVNSHYKAWRRPMLEAGAGLYEIRHDAAIQPIVADTPPHPRGVHGAAREGYGRRPRARLYRIDEL